MLYPITLDKERNLKYGMKAIDTLEKKFKKDILSVVRGFQNGMPTMQDLSVILWAGLVHEDKDLTPDKAMDLVDDYSNIKYAVESIFEALGDSLGMKKEESPPDDEDSEKNGEAEETPENLSQ
jgi:hypothetical protein